MKALPLLLAACLATAVVLAGCATTDDEAVDGGNQTGRQLDTEVDVEGDGTTNTTNETNETNETTGG